MRRAWPSVLSSLAIAIVRVYARAPEGLPWLPRLRLSGGLAALIVIEEEKDEAVARPLGNLGHSMGNVSMVHCRVSFPSLGRFHSLTVNQQEIPSLVVRRI